MSAKSKAQQKATAKRLSCEWLYLFEKERGILHAAALFSNKNENEKKNEKGRKLTKEILQTKSL